MLVGLNGLGFGSSIDWSSTRLPSTISEAIATAVVGEADLEFSAVGGPPLEGRKTQARIIVNMKGSTSEILPAMRNFPARGRYFQVSQWSGVLGPCMYIMARRQNSHKAQTLGGTRFLDTSDNRGARAATRNIDEPPKAPCTSARSGRKKLASDPSSESRNALAAQE